MADHTTHRGLPYRDFNPGADEHARSRCLLDLCCPKDATGFATVVFFHGGGMVQGDRELPTPLLHQGWAVAGAGYRLHPHVRHPTYIEDAAAAVAWVFKHIDEYGGDPGRIAVAGISAGAYLTLMLGLDKRYLAVHGIDADRLLAMLPLSPQVITHMTVRDEQGVSRPDVHPVVDQYAPLYHIRPDAPPTLCITGDWHLDLHCRAYENAYFAAMMKHIGHPDVEHVVVPGVGHATPPEVWAPGIQFLHRVLDSR